MTESTKQREEHQKWQGNSSLAWSYMGIYWLLGALVGIGMGYLPFPKPSISESNQGADFKWYLMSLAITLVVQPTMLSRFGPFGRQFSWCTVATFSLLNGIFETVLFLAAYDSGRWLAVETLGMPQLASVAFGFGIFSLYSAVIHSYFWRPGLATPHSSRYVSPGVCTSSLDDNDECCMDSFLRGHRPR